MTASDQQEQVVYHSYEELERKLMPRRAAERAAEQTNKWVARGWPDPTQQSTAEPTPES